MVQAILNKIKLRAVLIVLIIHAGLICGVVGLCTLPRPDGLEASHWLAIGGLTGVYGGLLLGILAVVLPLASLVRKIRRLMQWREWILEELPRIITLLPQVLEAIRAFFQALSKGGTVFSAMGDAAQQAQNPPGGGPATPAATGEGQVRVAPVPVDLRERRNQE